MYRSDGFDMKYHYFTNGRCVSSLNKETGVLNIMDTEGLVVQSYGKVADPEDALSLLNHGKHCK